MTCTLLLATRYLLSIAKMRVAFVLSLVVCFHLFPEDAISIPSNVRLNDRLPARPVRAPPATDFKYQWMGSDGTVYSESGRERLEIASTPAITKHETDVGTKIVRLMTRNMPSEVFKELASNATVGFFTKADKLTIFPEYAVMRDTPECKDICSGNCSDTCTSDGRKFDSLAGLGDIRAVCLNDNFMCTDADPYKRAGSVLVHEFTHTIHCFALSMDYFDKIGDAFDNAVDNNIWTLDSYAMSNEFEYFAEAAGVFFNTNKLKGTSSGGMNSCGHTDGTLCANEMEARDWLKKKDPTLFDLLSYTFTNNRPSLPSGLSVCVTA